MASQVADAAGAEQVIDTVGAHWTIPISAEITFPQGQQVLASRAFNTPWQRRLQRETAWLISGSLVERHDHGRWKVLRA
jgi:hypothetical protein